MTKLPSKNELRAQTRNWFDRGVLPASAADQCRWNAKTFPRIAEYHEACAAEWDRIAATQPEKVRAAYERERDRCILNLANHEPGSKLAVYWTTEAAKFDRLMGGEF